MAGIIRSDIDANNWQTVTPDDWSLIDHLKAYSNDARTALGNLGSNLLEGISPFHPDAAKAGAPSLQVPPMLQGIADSYSRLAGTPSKPGNAYDLTGVPELDAPIQGDMSNVSLSLYGGNAAAGLRRGVAAKGSASVAEMEAKGLPMDYQSMMARADAQGYDPMILYRGDNLSPTVLDPTMLGKNHPNALSKEGFFFTPESDYAQGYGKLGAYRARLGNHEVLTVDDISSLWHDPAPVREAKVRGADSVTLRDGRMPDEVVVFDPSRVRDVFQAEFDPSKVGQNGLLLSDTGKPSLLGSALATAGEQPKGITAYHGSPHDFDRFSLDKIGTGEGAQVYGHGLYFAENEGVAKAYRDALSAKVDNDAAMIGRADELSFRHSLNNDEQKLVRSMIYDKADAGEIDPISSYLDFYLSSAPSNVRPGKVREVIDQIDAPGRMYQVRINADPDSFLDWDKPLSQQSEKVRNALLPMLRKDHQAYPHAVTGQDAYRSIQGADPSNFMDQNAVPPKLREAGIPGIRYLDGNSRSAGAGSSNYVVFDDSLIDILNKYGLAGGAIGAGALNSLSQDPVTY